MDSRNKEANECLVYPNGCIGLLGLMLLARGAIAFYEINMFEQFALTEAIITSMAGGTILTFSSIILIVLYKSGACRLSRRTVKAYTLVPMIVAVMFLFSGVQFLNLESQLISVAEETVTFENGTKLARFNDFFLALFQVCCVEKSNRTAVAVCAQDVKLGCIYNQAEFDNFVDEVTNAECTLLRDRDVVNTTFVVNSTENEMTCGSLDAQTFVSEVSSFFAEYIAVNGLLNVLYGVLILVTTFSIVSSGCVTHMKANQPDINENRELKNQLELAINVMNTEAKGKECIT